MTRPTFARPRAGERKKLKKTPGKLRAVSDPNSLQKFLRKSYRDSYLQAQVRGGVAYQIQALRDKTQLSQTDFANKTGKKQSVISRLENTEYGRVSVQTLLDIACALDVALLVRFVSYPEFLQHTKDMSVKALQPETIYQTLDRAGQNSLGQEAYTSPSRATIQ